MKYLNLGCGDRYHKQWVNIEFYARREGVLSHNLLNGIPFDDNSFDVVYHSHLLEHFSKKNEKKFLRECFRVLKQDGVIRVVVPDLEQIAKDYLFFLNSAISGDKISERNYEWILLELFDQMVRTCSRGEMGKFLRRETIINEEYVKSRCGRIAYQKIRHQMARKNNELNNNVMSEENHFIKVSYIKKIFTFSTYKNLLKNLLFKSEIKYFENQKELLNLGKFRNSGEIHQWMYDRYSLSKLLEECEFIKIRQRPADDSYIKNWTSFNLDTEFDGTVYKPDSLYMEAIKP